MMDSLEQQQRMQGRPLSHSKHSNLWLEHAGPYKQREMQWIKKKRRLDEEQPLLKQVVGVAVSWCYTRVACIVGFLVGFGFLHLFSFCLSYLS